LPDSTKQTEITNQQKIRDASRYAEEALEYVSDDMPVGIITWDDDNTFIWSNPAITEKIQHLTKEDLQHIEKHLEFSVDW
jgi:c-di-AMP phosphodiesterase-like protein